MSKDQPSQSDIQPEGGSRLKATEDPDATDTEGHMPFRRGATEPGPDEPGADDTEVEGHELKATDDTDDTEGHGRWAKATEDPLEPEGYARH